MPSPPTVTWQSSVGPTAMSVNGPDERMCAGCCAAAGKAATNASAKAQATARRSEQNIGHHPDSKPPAHSHAARNKRPPCSHADGESAIRLGAYRGWFGAVIRRGRICGPTTVTSGLGCSAQSGGSTPWAAAAARAKWRSSPAGVQTSR